MTVGEWDHRELCPDGACVGVIGPTGTCKVCGRAAANWGEERTRGLVADETDDANDADADDDGDELAAGDAAEDDAIDPIAPSAPATLGTTGWTDRALCPDGACIGVIGDDGRCRVCGKRRPGPAAADGDADDSDDDDDELAAAADDLAAIAPLGAVAALTALGPVDADAEVAAEVTDEAGAERALCPDGACVGVIGPDGTCKLCGAEAA